jgi:4-amino-4-deoxy-L-arabinose transferase-like glycosyltransferase
VAIVAFGLRFLHIRALAGAPIFAVLLGDSKRYAEWGAEIARGDWLGSGAFYQAPFYPYLLGAIFTIFGESIEVVRVAQALAGTVACVLVAMAGRIVFDWRTGLLAGLLLAIYPPAIFFDGHIQKASIDLLLMAMVVFAIAHYQADERRRWLIVLGVSLGCFMLNRENARALYPVLVVWLVWWHRSLTVTRRVQLIAVFTAGVLAAIAPVALRNYYVAGDLLLSTSQLGSNFYIGNHQGATGIYEPLLADRGSVQFEQEDATRLASEMAGRTLSPGEVSNFWLSLAVKEIRADVGGWLRLMGRKLLLSVNAIESMDTESQEFHAAYSSTLRLLLPLTFGILFPLAIVGVVVTPDLRRVAVLCAIGLMFIGSVVIFFVLARYRHPVVAILVLFAAAAVTHAARAWRQRSRGVLVGIAVATAVAIVVNRPIHSTTDETNRNFGTELVRLGRTRDAIPFLVKAVEQLPNDPAVRRDLALAYLKGGEPSTAMREYATVVRLEPDSVANYRELGTAAQAAGDASAARDAYVRGLSVSGKNPEEAVRLHVLIAALDVAEGKPQDAIASLERASALARANGQLATANDIELTIQSVRRK